MIIIVDVKPGQQENIIEKISDDHFIVQIKAKAIKGKANKAIIKLLKKYFGKQVFIVSGQTSNRKIFEIEE